MSRDSAIPRIAICICTYKRPEFLAHLLDTLANLKTDDRISFYVLVVDNDPECSAKDTVASFSARNNLDYRYVSEPRKGISSARNRALADADASLMAFIDDDEYPESRYLLKLYDSMVRNDAVAVLGPVLADFPYEPPVWLVRCGTHHRYRPETDTKLFWKNTRTGNVLLDRERIRGWGVDFSDTFSHSGGEDIDFFRRLAGYDDRIFHEDDAVVFELVPENRMTPSYCLKRAWIQGRVSYLYYGSDISAEIFLKMFIKTTVAIICYALVLPIVIVFRARSIIRILLKVSHHMSRLLSMLGLAKDSSRNF